MPAVRPYIPNADTDFNSWLANFAALLTAAPATYGIVAGDAAAIQGVVDSWSAAYALVTSPTTKTPTTVQAKNDQKIVTLATVRPYAQTIANNAGVTSDNKIALGLNPRTNTPVPVPSPSTYPLLSIISSLSLQHVMRYRDQLASPTVKSKPYGAGGVQIFGKASVTPITDPAQLAYIQTATKSPLTVSLNGGDTGKQMYYAARYITKSGIEGPWAPIVNFTVAA